MFFAGLKHTKTFSTPPCGPPSTLKREALNLSFIPTFQYIFELQYIPNPICAGQCPKAPIYSNNKIYSKSHLCWTRHPWRSWPFQLLFPPVVRSASELVHKPLVRNNLEDFVLVVVPGMEEQEIKSSKFTSYQNQILFYQFLESCTLD